MKKVFQLFIQEIKTVALGLRSTLRMISDVSGLTHVLRKFLILEEDDKKYPSGPLWVIGNYFAVYQVAVLNYQGSVSHLERTIEQISVGVLDEKNRDYWLGLFPQVQLTKTLIKPKVWDFELTIQSFMGIESQNPDLNRVLIGIINSLKKNNKLIEANLKGLDLRRAELSYANLEGANLREANLEGANLKRADLDEAIVSLEQLQSDKVFKSTVLPDHIDKTQLTFED
jgi:hypothetical protein